MDYSKLIVTQKGFSYPSNGIKSYSHYNDPINHSAGRLAGNSRVWGDASVAVQIQVIDTLISEAKKQGLNDRDTAYLLAIAKVESGFNPDAAAGTTSASGLGQFVNKTGAAYDLNDTNRFDAQANSAALVTHFIENKVLAEKRGQGEEYIYKYHHDGPTGEYGGLGLSNSKVIPLVDQYEQVVKTGGTSTSISQVVVTKSAGWLDMLYDEVKEGASELGGWVRDGLANYLDMSNPRNAAITATKSASSTGEEWSFSNGLKIATNWVSGAKSWILPNQQGDTTTTQVNGVGQWTITDKSASGKVQQTQVMRVNQSGTSVNVATQNGLGETSSVKDVYLVQSGDTLSAISSRSGIPLNILIKVNPQITNPNVINIGDKIYIPTSVLDNNASAAPEGFSVPASKFYVDAMYNNLDMVSMATGISIANLIAVNPGLSADMSIAPGVLVNLPATTNLFTTTITDPAAIGSTSALDPLQPVSANTTTLIKTGTSEVTGIGNVNTASGNTAYANDIITNLFRPGEQNLTTEILGSTLAQNFLANPDLINSPVWNPETKAAAMNLLATGVLDAIPTDPLVLDLNGDGVKLTSFADAPVLFDIDHDGGSKEVTGWISAQDGIVVMDINGNGKIDDISETLSEYFNGAVGTNGTKPYANGFAALKSLDSNSDNAFTSADAAWSNVKVWADANHDGKTDTGELKTLASLGITSINLTPTTQSGLVNGGNEILASGTFTQNGQTKEAQAVRLIANPTGNSATTTASGTTQSAQDGQSTYVSNVTTGETIDVAAKGVKNAYGNSGNDTLTGDANANWLAGGIGSDTFNAGAGDDVLLIDAADLQANIHAGSGFDMVQVVGSVGVTLNLAQAEVEVAIGGSGSDVLIGGGRSSVFIRAGDGDDIVIGGAANDALSGEDGNDLIDGGAGNEVIYGGRGQDQLMGGAGDDVIFAGQDDDNISGGAGNDVLKGEQGDDTIDGGDGIDFAEYTGSYADYRVTRINNSAWRVVDSKTGRDGADILKNIEQISFADIGHFDINQPTALPVKDILTQSASGQALTRTGSYYLSKQQLLSNDRSWQGGALTITGVLDAKGGTTQLITNTADPHYGDILFTPDAAYKGVMSFKYQVSDANGNVNSAINSATGFAEQMKGTVYLQTPDLPGDPLMLEQWYLGETNVIPVWQDYTGKGIRIGQFEPSGAFAVRLNVLDYTHPDLQGSVDKTWLNDSVNPVPQTFSNHATMVAGVMVAGRNGLGGIGVAYDAKVSGNPLPSDLSEFYLPQPGQQIDLGGKLDSLYNMKNYDVVNASWNTTGTLAWTVFTGNPDPHEQAAALGRNYKGTVMVYSAGNDRAKGGNTNISNLTSQRWAITVGAVNAKDDTGSLVSGAKPFSSPGASILVSAPGSNITTTARELMNADGSVFGSDAQTAKGTSLATPIVSGIVALMLEANPNLGYRDVQEILALSAKKIVDPTGTDWVDNGSSNWNGGGMHVSHDYGFGEVDALAAARLAETWESLGDYVNEKNISGTVNLPEALPDGTGYVERSITIGSGVTVEHVELNIGLTAARLGDLIVELYSPSGTRSILLNRPGKAPGSAASDLGSNLPAGGQGAFTFSTTHDWGEDSAGTWKVRIYDAVTGNSSAVGNIQLNIYGKQAIADDNYVFTDEYSSFAPGTRSIITDIDGGYDTINASAVSSSSAINLTDGAFSIIDGKSVQLVGTFEEVFGGDGDDLLTGNGSFNDLTGGRGNDTLQGGAGEDFLDGGKGNDTLSGGADADMFVICSAPNSSDTILDFNPAQAAEKILLVGFEGIEDFTRLGITASGADSVISLGLGQTLTLKSVLPGQLSEQNFTFITKTAMNSPGFDLATYKLLLEEKVISHGDDSIQQFTFPATGPSSVNYFAQGGDDKIAHSGERSVLDGGNGNDIVFADYNAPVSGLDWVDGGAGNDELHAGDFADVVSGGAGDDDIYGDGGDDYLRGDSGRDAIFGGDGNDILIGGEGADYLSGEGGNDTLFLEGDTGEASAASSEFYGNRFGGTGADIFRVVAHGGGSSAVTLDPVTGDLLAANLVADFDVNQPGELIDLSDHPWVRGMADLSVSSQTLGGILVTTISSNDGTNSVCVNLWGVPASQLGISHFKFAAAPGLVFDGRGNDATDGINAVLTGDAGANTLDGGTGVDAMTGRTGDDTYLVDNAGDTVNELPDGGFDTVKSGVSYTLPANVENLVLTGTAAINGTGNEATNRIAGNAADNMLDGKGGVDTLLGGAGNDTYVVDSQADTVTENANEGTDTVQSSVSYTLGNNIENLTLTGTASINATGNDLPNTLTGNAGDNLLDGAAGADAMFGSAGDDTYFVDSGGDTVVENTNEGIDTVYAAVNYTLGINVENLVLGYGVTSGAGNASDNLLTGNSSSNTLSGGAGADTLDGGAGADVLVGGTGDDIYVIDNPGEVITELAGEGSDTVLSSITFDISTRTNIENVVLTGTANLNATGNAADNRLTGNAGANVLSGDAGNDTLDGGAGADTLIGGTGDDIYVVDSAGDTLTENANEGTDSVVTFNNYILAANVENLTLAGGIAISGTGNALNNTLTGNSNGNTLDGGVGADTLIGGAGDDTYVVDDTGDVVTELAGEGADTVRSSIDFDLSAQQNIENVVLTGIANLNATGNATDNYLAGNAGDNYLLSGAGNDMLDGGAGNDYLIDRDGGSDTYAFGRGYGQDIVFDRSMAAGDLDTVQMSAGVLPTDVKLKRDVRNLYLTIAGTTDRITLNNWFTSAYTIEQVAFADGSVWDTSTLQAKVRALDTPRTPVPPPPSPQPLEPVQIFLDAAASFYKNNTEIAFNIDSDGSTHLSYTNPDGTANTFDAAYDGSYTVSQIPTGCPPTYVSNDPAKPYSSFVLMQSPTTGGGAYFEFGDGVSITLSPDGTSQYQVPLPDGGSIAILVDDSGNGTHFKVFDAGGTLVSQTVTSYDAGGNYVYTQEALPPPPATDSGGGSTPGQVTGTSIVFSPTMEALIRSFLETHPSEVQIAAAAVSAGFTIDQVAAALNLVNGTTLSGSSIADYIYTTLSGQFLVGAGGFILSAAPVALPGFSADMEQTIREFLATDPTPAQIAAAAITEGFSTDRVAAALNLVEPGRWNANSIATYINTYLSGQFSVGLGGVIFAGTPIVLDLDGNGVSLVPLAQSTAAFDIAGSGARLKTGWAAPGDALLAYDADGNGLIDRFNEISFTGYVAGATTDLEGLSAFDTDHDGKLTAQDALWDKLQLWQDKNQDGVSDAGELSTLAQAGITAIGLDSNHQVQLLGGNVIFGTTRFTRTDGSTGLVGDVKFDYAVPGRAATGSDGDDVISGSNGDDRLEGKGGNDVLIGLGGKDLLDGGSGIDTMFGGAGDDVYIVDNAGDRVLEKPGEGVDMVRATVSHTLGANVEVLELTGSANIDATGNDLANRLVGNDGANTLTAGGGNDTLIASKGIARMVGGTGDDIYLVNNAADIVIENAGEGIDLVLASANFALADNVENLILTGSATQGTGNALNNILTGNSLGNQLDGGAGDDVLLTGNGNDILDGGAGADAMVGSGGNDTYIVDNAGDAVKEKPGEGSDTVRASISYALSDNVENLILSGNANIDGAGNSLANLLIGNAGNNVLDGKAGADTLTGGAGDDAYVVDNAGDVVTEEAGQGTDTVYSAITYVLSENVENLVLTGTASHDGSGNALDNVLVGNRGDNILDGGAGADTMLGGAGDDTYYVDNFNDIVIEEAGEGTDTIVTGTHYALWGLPDNVENLILTGTANLFGYGNALDNTISGNGGNNLLDGGLGADTMAGGLGNDTYIVDNTGDRVVERANEGIDTIKAGGSHTLETNVENLILTGTDDLSGTGNTLDNAITGNAGNNELDGGLGADTMAGGAGDDSYIVDNVGDKVIERANEGVDTVKAKVSYTLSDNLENLVLIGNNALTGTGNALANVLTANAAGDTLLGGRGNDTLCGGAGNDLLNGGSDSDAMRGNKGDDSYFVDNVGDTVIENSGEGTDTVTASIDYTLGANVEKLVLAAGALRGTGNELDNTLTGNDLDNTLDGGTGSDAMAGGKGNDIYLIDNAGDIAVEKLGEGVDTVKAGVSRTLEANVENLILTGNQSLTGIGNELDNVLTANDAGDTLGAGAGKDTLLGGAGQDTLDGGSGNDFLDGGAGDDLMKGGTGDDLYLVDNAGDLVVENLGEGTDFVMSSIAYTLTPNVENLTLSGTADINGSGNELDNVINGNSGRNTLTGLAGNDRLDGGLGADTLIGGSGNDTYIVDDAGDLVVEYGAGDEGGSHEGDSHGDNHGDGHSEEEGIDTVLAGISYVLPAHVENLTLTGSADLNGSGNGLGNVIFGNAGNNFLSGDAGNDTLDGGDGLDVLSGGTGNDILRSGRDNSILLGDNGDDTLSAVAGNNFFAGGKQDDVITTGSGHNVVAFNHEDRNDIVLPSSGANNTLSLGSGIGYDSLKLAKHGDDLVLDAGENNSVTFKSWYADAANRNFVTLQMIDDARGNGNSGNGGNNGHNDANNAGGNGNDGSQGNSGNNGNSDNGNHGNSDNAHDNSGNGNSNGHSAEDLFTHKIEVFDFTALVAQFDQARTAHSNLDSWGLMDALLDAHLASSDTAALGGDLAFQYGVNGSLAGVSLGAAQEVVSSTQFGSQQQALRPWAGISGGAVQLG